VLLVVADVGEGDGAATSDVLQAPKFKGKPT
jgi:hypothetical protein